MLAAQRTSITGVGLGLRWQFLDSILSALDGEGSLSPIQFFEVAPENYMRRGGYFPAMLHRIAEKFPILSHGLTLSLGSVDPLDGVYLAELRRFLKRYGSPFHSDHLCFCGVGGAMSHDLLPLPFTNEAVDHVVCRIRKTRDMIATPFAIENITYYRVPGVREMDEATFLETILTQANCGLLLDVNNVYVNARNHGDYEPKVFIDSLPLERVWGLHVAGHEREGDLVIDTHGADIPDPVEDLVEHVIAVTGPLPVVVERDHNIPPFAELLAEVARVQKAYDRGLRRHLEKGRQ